MLKTRFEILRRQQESEAAGTARKSLADPNAYDLPALYDLSNARLEELRGERTLFHLDPQILQNNLYGVDLNAKAIQIRQLSLWIKTVARGKQLTSFARPRFESGVSRSASQ